MKNLKLNKKISIANIITSIMFNNHNCISHFRNSLNQNIMIKIKNDIYHKRYY
jgi:hypothetical protein